MFVPQIAVVDFHHHRGPEVEFWVDPVGIYLSTLNDWSQLPFLALPDGAHATTEEFSYFTLLHKNEETNLESTLFGLACTRQIRSDKLKVKSPDVTRSFVQKAVVVVVDKPGVLGMLRERLATISAAWFAQEDFTNQDILKEFQASLHYEAETRKYEKDSYFGLSLRELVHDLRYQTLVLFKCLLLEKRVLFFGTRCEKLCLTQFALVSLIPHLLESLQDCAAPALDTYSQTVTRATTLKTSERSSLMAYMGLPLQIFGLNAFFSPYTPLQQLDFLASPISKSYVAGSTNTLFLAQRDLVSNTDGAQQKHRYCDVLVNLDEINLSAKLSILDPSLRSALALSAADRRWIDHLAQTVLDTWNPTDPSRPTTHGYQGSEDAIRLSFEEYVLSLLSSTAYKKHFDDHPNPYLSQHAGGVSDERYPDPLETANDFSNEFLSQWRGTSNFALWRSLTDDTSPSLFEVIEPRHPTAGGLSIEDVQRRLGAAVSDLHLDDRVRQGRETAGKAIEAGRERVGAGVARFWKGVEEFKERRDASRSRTSDNVSMRKEVSELSEDSGVTIEHDDVFDASRKSNENTSPTPNIAAAPKASNVESSGATNEGWAAALRSHAVNVQRPNVDTTQVQAAAKENAARAGAYLSSWGTWARDKSREWQEGRQVSTQTSAVGKASRREIANVPQEEALNNGLRRQGSLGTVAAAKSAMTLSTSPTTNERPKQ